MRRRGAVRPVQLPGATIAGISAVAGTSAADVTTGCCRTPARSAARSGASALAGAHAPATGRTRGGGAGAEAALGGADAVERSGVGHGAAAGTGVRQASNDERARVGETHAARAARAVLARRAPGAPSERRRPSMSMMGIPSRTG
jgi:hypothetical protein